MSSKPRTGLPFLAVLLAAVLLCGVARASTIESEVTAFVKQMYPDSEFQITFAPLPHQARGEVQVKTLGFSKVPDVNGEGVCLAATVGKTGRENNVYVPFKILFKRKLYVAKRTIKKGDVLDLPDLSEKGSFLNGAHASYPNSAVDIIGKVAKKEIPAGEIVATTMLDDVEMVQKGEAVMIRAENNAIVVQGKGTALDKGKIGDLVRVKSLSGKEIIGTVTGTKVVAVQF